MSAMARWTTACGPIRACTCWSGPTPALCRRALLPYAPDLATIDVSFISLRKVLPRSSRAWPERYDVLALVKPQFEVGRARVGKGGVVRDQAAAATRSWRSARPPWGSERRCWATNPPACPGRRAIGRPSSGWPSRPPGRAAPATRRAGSDGARGGAVREIDGVHAPHDPADTGSTLRAAGRAGGAAGVALRLDPEETRSTR